MRLSRDVLPPLYAIADADVLGLDRIPAAVATMASRGLSWIQIRAKHAPDDRLSAAVERAAPNMWLGPRVVRAGGRTKLVFLFGASEDTALVRSFEVAAGRGISRRDVDLGRRVVVLGATAATRLFGRAPVVGRTVHVESVPFEVVGVTQPKGDQLIFMGPLDDEVERAFADRVAAA